MKFFIFTLLTLIIIPFSILAQNKSDLKTNKLLLKVRKWECVKLHRENRYHPAIAGPITMEFLVSKTKKSISSISKKGNEIKKQ